MNCDIKTQFIDFDKDKNIKIQEKLNFYNFVIKYDNYEALAHTVLDSFIFIDINKFIGF